MTLALLILYKDNTKDHKIVLKHTFLCSESAIATTRKQKC